MQTSGSFFSQMPPVTKNLIIINLIVWLAMFILPGKIGMNIEDFGGLHYFKASDFNPAQLLTYMFMHSTTGFAHIFFNMFMLFMFGMTLERSLGSSRFLFYYISCGVGAALVQEATWAMTWEHTLLPRFANLNHIDFETARQYLDMHPAFEAQLLNNMVTIGASGAIYGVLLAFGMLYPNSTLYLYFAIPVKAKWMVLGMGVIELLIGLSESAGRSDGDRKSVV